MCSKIFCFDLDMTLLDHKTFHISEKVLKDLEALKKEGHVVAVATGRDMDSEFSKAYKKQLQPGYVLNGHLSNPAVSGRYGSHGNPLPDFLREAG